MLVMSDVGLDLAGRTILRDLNLGCPAGSLTALVGRNGAGKSSTVTVAAGLRLPAHGTVLVGGYTPRSREGRMQFGYVPQEIDFPAGVSVAQCVDFVAAQRAPSVLATPRGELCEQLGLSDLLGRRVGGLSGGQRRRLAIALALVEAPVLLLLDEATTNLDEASRAATWALLEAHVARGGAALVTSHILADIESHADRIVALDAGRVVMDGTRDDVRRRLGDSIVAARIPPAQRAPLLSRIDALGLAGPAGVAGDELTWRTAQPARLVAEIALLAPDATDLRVTPTPLSTLLAGAKVTV